jgi:hypothetical protein
MTKLKLGITARSMSFFIDDRTSTFRLTDGLLVSQGDHRIDFHRPPRGNVTREKSYGDKNHRDDNEGQRIGWSDAEEHA